MTSARPTARVLRRLPHGLAMTSLLAVGALLLYANLVNEGRAEGGDTTEQGHGTIRPVTVETVRRVAVDDTLLAMGRAVPADVVAVPAPDRAAAVIELVAQPGDWLQQGDLIARLDPAKAAFDLREAEARVASALSAEASATDRQALAITDHARARDALDRTEQLAGSGSVSATQLETATLDAARTSAGRSIAARVLDAARSDLALAHLQRDRATIALAETEISAPVAGRVLTAPLLRGITTTPGMEAATLARDGLVAVELDLPAHRLSALDLGQTVSLDLGQGQTLLADVTRLPFGTDGAAPTVPVRFTLSGDHGLRPGMAVKASVTLSQRIAIRIPLGALTRHGDAHAVMRVIDGRVVATPVVLAATQPDSDTQTQIEITDGLRDGDLIVSLAATLLADGERVAVPGAPAHRRLAGDLTGSTGP